MIDIRHAWGLERVYYYDAQQKLKFIPLSWTSLQSPDPFVICAAGRSPFRIQDLLELCSLLQELSSSFKGEENV